MLDVRRHPGAALQGLWNRAANAALRDLLRRHDPRRTIVHLHGYTKALTTAPMRVARAAGFRGVCTLHDFFAACPNGAFYDYRRQDAVPARRALSAGCALTNCDKRHALHKAYRVLRGMVQRYVAGFPASVRDFITLSHRSAALLRPYLPRGRRVVSAGQHHRPAASAARSMWRPTARLLVLGRLEAEKGVVLAAEAARAGRHADRVRRRRALPCRCGSRRRARHRLAGQLPQVWDAIGQARCLVFPSRWYETFGLVVTEAAARGVPAIVSDITAPAERIEPGVTGWLFRSGDLAELAALHASCAGRRIVRQAGQAAYDRFWAAPPDRARHVRGLLDDLREGPDARDHAKDALLAS